MTDPYPTTSEMMALAKARTGLSDFGDSGFVEGLEVLRGSGSELPFPDATFDLVALLDTVEHIADEFGVTAFWASAVISVESTVVLTEGLSPSISDSP